MLFSAFVVSAYKSCKDLKDSLWCCGVTNNSKVTEGSQTLKIGFCSEGTAASQTTVGRAVTE